MIVLDTSGVLAALRSNDLRHEAARRALLAATPPRIISPFVLAELDYMVSRDLGPAAEEALLEDVGAGAYTLAPFDPADVTGALETIRRYADLTIGLADASVLVLAERYQTRDVLTLDLRHFRAFRTREGKALRLLPEDG